MMNKEKSTINLSAVKWGLALAMLTLLINIAFGALFGLNEDMFQNYIQAGISAHPALFKPNDAEIIWRMVQRAHFHAGGIGAYSLGLVIVTALTSMSEKRKQITALLIGLSIFYPLAWFAMFLVAPDIGRSASHHAFLPELFTRIGVGGLCLGMLSLIVGVYQECFQGKKA